MEDADGCAQDRNEHAKVPAARRDSPTLIFEPHYPAAHAMRAGSLAMAIQPQTSVNMPFGHRTREAGDHGTREGTGMSGFHGALSLSAPRIRFRHFPPRRGAG